MLVLYRTHRPLPENVVHIVRERSSQYNCWDPLCLIGWNAFVPTNEIADEMPTCLECIAARWRRG